MSTSAPSSSGMMDERLLLDAIVERRSQEAFGQLVQRHLPMVYSHARRELRDSHRAEDVAQAVFLLLWQRAGTISGGSVAGWLYRVTHLTCRNAQRIDARRRRHEREARAMVATVASGPGMATREVEVQLDGILQQLPARDREALLLRYGYGYSVAEIGGLMSASEAAVKKRLHRALERVRGCFAARGIVVQGAFTPAGILAAQGVPAHLSASTLAAASAPSAAVAQLAHGATALMVGAKLKLAGAVAAAVFVLLSGTVFLLVQHVRGPWVEARGPTLPAVVVPVSEPVAAPAGDADRVFTVRGVVLNPAGQPVTGARVTVPGPYSWRSRMSMPVVARALTGADGRFEVSYRRSAVAPFSHGDGTSGSEEWKKAALVASASGYGMAWRQWDDTDAAGNVVLQLVADDVPVEGRILMADGQPAANIPIEVMSLEVGTEKERQAAYEKDAERAHWMSMWLPRQAAGMEPLFTDREGRFRIAGLGRDRWMTLLVHGPSVGFSRIDCATRNMAPETRTIDQPIGTSDQYVTYGARFEFKAPAGLSVEGTVRDAGTRQPIAGVTVESVDFAGKFMLFDPLGMLSTVTDSRGKYRLDGFPRVPPTHKWNRNEVLIYPGEKAAYFLRRLKIEDSGEGQSVATVDVDLDKGVEITGRVTDKRTGQPLAARVSWTTYKANEHTWGLDAFRREDGAGFRDRVEILEETNPDGTFHLVGVPGAAIVSAESLSGSYLRGVGLEHLAITKTANYVFKLYQPCALELSNEVKEVEIPETATAATVNFELDTGKSIRVHLVDPEGKPIGNCSVRGDDAENYGGWYAHLVKGDSFEATTLNNQHAREIVVLNTERHLGKAVRFLLADVTGGDLTIQLEPVGHLTGRCVEEGTGKPVRNVELRASVTGVGLSEKVPEMARDIPSTLTDSNGRFSLEVIPGGEVWMCVNSGIYANSVLTESTTVEAGKTVDLGEVSVKKWADQQ